MPPAPRFYTLDAKRWCLKDGAIPGFKRESPLEICIFSIRQLIDLGREVEIDATALIKRNPLPPGAIK